MKITGANAVRRNVAALAGRHHIEDWPGRIVAADHADARLGFDLSPAVSGTVPVKVSGKIAGGPEQTTKLGIEADLTSVKLDNILPGWVKLAGWVLVVSACLAYYLATAMMLAASAGKVLLPLGKPKKDANKPGAQPVRPIELEWGEPGVKQGQ